MSQFAWVALAALLLYFALRVWRLKRPSLPFLVAYPLFVAVLLGGALATFVAASRAAASFGYTAEDPIAMVGVFGVTGLASLVLWWIARRAIRGGLAATPPHRDFQRPRAQEKGRRRRPEVRLGGGMLSSAGSQTAT